MRMRRKTDPGRASRRAKPTLSRRLGILILAVCLLLMLGGCGWLSRITGQPNPVQPGPSTGVPVRLRVVATTSIIADVVQQVAGEEVAVTALMPPGTDPHSYEPSPRDMAAVAGADVVFANGLSLEVFLEDLVENTGAAGRVVEVSDGIDAVRLPGPAGAGDPAGPAGAAGPGDQPDQADHESHPGTTGEGGQDEPPTSPDPEQRNNHDNGPFDPHVWLDPRHVLKWTENIADTLSRLDPARAGFYRANAAAYEVDLEALDAWIHAQVAQVPPEDRAIICDHEIFGYFARRYGFEQVGSVTAGVSTMAEPSAAGLAELSRLARDRGVRAIVTGLDGGSKLVQALGADLGLHIVRLHTGSLSGTDGPAATYIEFMRYNVTSLVEALAR